MKIVITLLSIVGLFFTTTTGCGWSNKAKGGAIGAGAGGVAGGLIGRAQGNTARGAIIGAAVGGTAGVLIGNRMDKQAEEMRRDMQNAKIERVGEGIKVTFDSGILFETDSYQLQPAAKANIEAARISTVGLGETNPIASNDTEDGRRQNRRVEVAIFANEDMKNAARSGRLD